MISADPRALLLTVQVFTTIVGVVTSPLMAAVILELHFDLRLRHEGTVPDAVRDEAVGSIT